MVSELCAPRSLCGIAAMLRVDQEPKFVKNARTHFVTEKYIFKNIAVHLIKEACGQTNIDLCRPHFVIIHLP